MMAEASRYRIKRCERLSHGLQVGSRSVRCRWPSGALKHQQAVPSAPLRQLLATTGAACRQPQLLEEAWNFLVAEEITVSVFAYACDSVSWSHVCKEFAHLRSVDLEDMAACGEEVRALVKEAVQSMGAEGPRCDQRCWRVAACVRVTFMILQAK